MYSSEYKGMAMAKSVTPDAGISHRELILNGPIVSTFLRLGLPLLLVRLVQDIYGIVDAFWLSRYSQYSMSVPRQVWPSYMLFTVFVMGFCSANLALLSQYVGARMYDMVVITFRKMIGIAVISGIVSGLTFFMLSPYMFAYIVQVPQEIVADALGYAYVMSIDMVVLSLSMSLSTLLQSLGDTRATATSQIVGSIANIFLDPLFISGLGVLPAMGAMGAAIATVLSKILSILIMVIVIAKKYPWIRIDFARDIDLGYIVTTLKIAVPLLVMGVSNSLAFNLQNRLVNTFGVIATTAFSLGFILFDLANTSLWGLTEGIAIMIGQNLGAGNIERSRSIAEKTSLFIFTTVAASSIVIYVVRDHIASMFITGQGIETQVIESIYHEYYKFISSTVWTLAFFALTFSAMSVGRGSGHTLMPTLINVIRLWFIRIGLGYLLALALGLGTTGVYFAFALSNIVGGLVSILWIFKGSWAKPIITSY